jgi:DNA polymerase I
VKQATTAVSGAAQSNAPAFDLVGDSASSPSTAPSKTIHAPALTPTIPAKDAAEQNAIERRYECVVDQTRLDAWLAKIATADLVCVDTETTGLDALVAELVGISLSAEEGVACYIPLAHRTGEDQLDRQSVLDQMRPG